MKRFNRSAAVAATLAGSAGLQAPAAVLAQGDPTKPITPVVPFASTTPFIEAAGQFAD